MESRAGRRPRAPFRRIAAWILFLTGACAPVIAAGQAVGRTVGIESVSPLGEAQYIVPLFAPRGAGGLTPALALSYSHRAQEGVLGVGWSIAGLSGITRCNRTIAQDGTPAAPRLEVADGLCLDSNRLRLTGGGYGTAGSTYQTEIETYARITAYGAAGDGPAWFRVETRDGLLIDYGNSTDSRILSAGSATARAWAVSRIADRAGNYMEVAYYNDTVNGSYRPRYVRWTGNAAASLAPRYELEFVYATFTRPDPLYGYVAGDSNAGVDGRVNELRRLDRIDVKHDGGIVRRYSLGYDTGGAGARSRLTTIVECGIGAASCFPATTFTYLPATSGFGGETSLGVAAAGNRYPVDINGDGRDDMVWSSSSTDGAGFWHYMLANGSGSYDAPQNSGISNSGTSFALPLEWDGDGRWDLLVPFSGGTWWVIRANGNGFDGPVDTGVSAASPATFRVADLNGDGRDDLVRSATLSGVTIAYRLREASNFAAAETSFVVTGATDIKPCRQWPWGRPTDPFRSAERRADFNGDGRQDALICVEVWEGRTIVDTGWLSASLEPGLSGWEFNGLASDAPLIGDFNEDSLTDVMSFDGSQSWYALSRGRGFHFPAPTSGGGGLRVVLDFDGDGRDDLLESTGGTWFWYRSLGNGFSAAANTGVGSGGATRALAADVNGDALVDLTTDAGSLFVRLRAGTFPDLLDQATDGFGRFVNFDYLPMTSAAVYDRGTGAAYPVRELQDGRPLVQQYSASSPAGTGYSVSFRYGAARIEQLGRGFLGFGTRRQIDGSGGHDLRTIETYRQDYPYIGGLASVEVQQASGVRIRLVQNAWSSLAWGAGGTERRYPYVSTTTTHDHEVGGAANGTHFRTVSNTVAALDAPSGLVTDATAAVTEVATGLYAGSSRSERLLHSGVLNDFTQWCLGRPQSTQLTASHTAGPFGGATTRSADAVWDTLQCRPTQRRIEPGNGQLQVTMALGYDAFGNVNTRTVTGIGTPGRTTSANWGARGQFPESITNALGQSETRAWNYDFGLPATASDPNGITMSWQYDAFGRQTLEQRPDQTRTSWSYLACNGCDPVARYRVLTQHQNTSGVTFRTDEVHLDAFDLPVQDLQQMYGGASAVAARFVRDSRGRVVEEYVPYWSGFPHNGRRVASYDALDRMTSVQWFSANGTLKRSEAAAYAGLSSTVTDPRSNSTVRFTTAWGDLLRVTDAAGGSANHLYDAFGNIARVTDAHGNVSTEVTYNIRGMRTGLSDMNLGAWIFTPNALGEVVSQQDAKGQLSSFAYDLLGRRTSRTEAEGTSTWTWGTSAGAHNIGKLAYVSGPGYSESFTYNSFDQVVSRTINSDATYQFSYSFNDIGALHTLTYPTSTGGARFKVKYGYAQGQLGSVRDFTGDVDGTVFWSKTTVDPRGTPIFENFGNGLRVVTGFDPLTGAMEYRESGTGGLTTNIQNLRYEWDAAGNLVSRADINRNLTETAVYDALNRLDFTRLNGTVNLDVGYDLIGNITSKTGVGSYTYHATRKNAVVGAGTDTFAYDANGNITTMNGGLGSATWASYNLPTLIQGPSNAGMTSNQFWYDPERQRWRQVINYAGITETTIYVGGLLEKVTKGGVTTFKHYVTGFDGASAIVTRRSDGVNGVQYLTRDHLASVDTVTNAAGAVQVRLSYDGFGRRRNEATWSGNVPTADFMAIDATTDRAYTGHEYLDNIGFVHMNGRVYMPKISRFMSADPVADGFGRPGGYNRYAYVSNNPLGYVDPSGLCADNPNTRTADPCEDHPGGAFGFWWDVFMQGGLLPSILRSLDPPLRPEGPIVEGSRRAPGWEPPDPRPPAREPIPSAPSDRRESAQPHLTTILDIGLGVLARVADDMYTSSWSMAGFEGESPVRVVPPESSEGQLGWDIGLAASILVTKKPGTVATRAGAQALPKLQRIHSVETLTKGSARYSYDSIRKMSTDDIVKSLRPGSSNPLTVKPDGRIFEGNTRILVLEERGFDINSLPRVILGD